MVSLTIHQTHLPRKENVFSNQTNARFKRIYSQAEHVWSYLGKIMILTRHLLSAASKSCQLISVLGKAFPGKAGEITTRLKLFSIVGVPFSLNSLKSMPEKISKRFLLNDTEGVVLSSLSLTMLVMEVFDSITTFVNTTLTLSARTPIPSLAALGLPFGFTMSGLSTVSRIIQIAQTCRIYRGINSIRKEMFEAFLEKKLNVTAMQARIVAPLKGHILRALPEIEQQLYTLYDLITNGSEAFTNQEMNKISQVLDDIQNRLKKKFVMEGLGMIANTLIIAALCLFCLGSLSSMPFALLAASFFIRISSLIYQDLA